MKGKVVSVWVLAIGAAIFGLLSLSFFLFGASCPRGCNWDARRISDIRQIQNALERYFNNCGVYPGGAPKAGSDPKCAGISRPSQLVGLLRDISNIPRDPTTEADYSYCYTAGGASYALQANLEDVSNAALRPALATPPAGCTNTVGAVTCDKAKGEYCVSL